MHKIISLLITILGLALHLQAQITPSLTGPAPVLNCVKNEVSNKISIQWTASVPIGPCFRQYSIYISRGDRTGPYIKLDSINTPGDGTLILDPQYSGSVYVFMVNEQSCSNPVTQAITSDTLDNIVPHPVIEIINVTVENNLAQINWIPSTNPEVSSYAIYSNINNYNEPIDTVDGRSANTYIDYTRDPSKEIPVYRIRSLEFCEDPAGLYGNISPPYNTILVSASEEEPCKRAVQLSWNGYNNQTQPVLGYRIDYSEDAGNTFQIKADLGSDARTFNFEGLTANISTCIRVVAILPENVVSYSNLLCVVGKGITPVEDHYIRSISVAPDHVLLEYIPDLKADMGEIAIERSANGVNFSVLGSGVSIQQPEPDGPYIIKDFSALTDRTAYWYKVTIKNTCNNFYSTEPAKTVFEDGSNKGLNNVITWETSSVAGATVSGYNIFRIINGDTTRIHSQAQSGTYTDNGIYANNNFVEACYFVEADYRFNEPDRPADLFSSRSNTICLKPLPQAFVPNAFAPQGVNKIFKPILVFGTEENYLLEVFDRNGAKVFESNSPKIGWNGTNKGLLAPLDSYIYFLRFTGLDGVSYQKTGFVMLLK